MTNSKPTARHVTQLDQLINATFPGLAVRKDLVKAVKGNAIVPSYVLEYLLGQHCATDDPDSIASGVERVRDILSKHFVQRNEAGLVKSLVEQKGRHKVIDKIAVELNDTGGYYQANFTNLGLKKVPLARDYIKQHPKLLVGGVWCIADVLYQAPNDPNTSPWEIDQLKPIQVSRFDFEGFLSARRTCSTEQWMALLMQTIGFDPTQFSRRGMLIQFARLIPFCERNYNLIELGPKGTGKSHIYSEFSPHGMLISGGEVSTAKLFVNNQNGKIGLVGYWDCICFDEFAGKDKRVDKNLIDIMKNYMANKSFSRGIETMGADASMVFMGNTKRPVAYMLKHSHLFDQLPEKYIDSAFLDRLHAYLPGWEVSPIQNDLFTSGYGLIVDYFAEILRHLRTLDFAHLYDAHFDLSPEITTRDRDGIRKTFAGLMKILYPHQESTRDELQELLEFAMECRKRVKDHILRIDDTFAPVDFALSRRGQSGSKPILTAEEVRYPEFGKPILNSNVIDEPSELVPAQPVPTAVLPNHVIVPENVTGYSYRRLFADHLRGARSILVNDPYIRSFWQIRNCLELLQLIHELVPEGDEATFRLVTRHDEADTARQERDLEQVATTVANSRVAFTFDFDDRPHFHARSIETDTGWKITLDRGLDIFQKYEMGMLSLAALSQEHRLTKGCEVTYLRLR